MVKFSINTKISKKYSKACQSRIEEKFPEDKPEFLTKIKFIHVREFLTADQNVLWLRQNVKSPRLYENPY